MRIVNRTKKIGDLESGRCYMFHDRIYMKIDIECPESTEEEPMSYVVDPSNGHCISVKNSSSVKLVDPDLSY